MYTICRPFARACALVACVLCCGTAFAGSPPLITDDPETPGAGGWEVNITSSFEKTRDESEMEVPLFDFNYGFGDNDQLKVEFAVEQFNPDDEDDEWGVGDLLVGYKYRFLEEDEGIGWMVSIYPQVSSPTGDEERELGSGNTEMLIPFEFEKHFCNDQAWVNPEIGYNIVFGDHDANSWKFGLAMGWQETEKLELMGEVGAFVFPNDIEPDVPFFNFGFAYELNENVALLGSAGRSFRSRDDGTPEFFCLLGFQFTWGAMSEGGEEGGAEGNESTAL